MLTNNQLFSHFEFKRTFPQFEFHLIVLQIINRSRFHRFLCKINTGVAVLNKSNLLHIHNDITYLIKTIKQYIKCI